MAEFKGEASTSFLQRSAKFQEITKKYGVQPGSEISIKKLSINLANSSDVKVGEVLTGVIGQEVGLGKSLFLFNQGKLAGNTSGIVKFRENDGHLQFLKNSLSL